MNFFYLCKVEIIIHALRRAVLKHQISINEFSTFLVAQSEHWSFAKYMHYKMLLMSVVVRLEYVIQNVAQISEMSFSIGYERLVEESSASERTEVLDCSE